MQLNKYRKAISVFFAALILITVCVVLPVTASAGFVGEAKAEEAAISDILPGEGGMARNNDGADADTSGDMLDPDNGTVGNDEDHDDGNGSGTSDGKNDSRNTSDADSTSDKKDDVTSDKNNNGTSSAGDTTKDLANDVKDEANKMGVWGVIIAIIIIVIIIALIFAIIPKRKK